MSDQIDDETLKLAALCAPDGTADLKAWLRETFALKDDGRDEMRWKAWRAAQRGVHAGSSLEEFLGTPERTPITVQRPTEGDVVSLDFERERANKMGLADMNGSSPTALTGSRRFKR
jgi:hypothetical protein